jgi:hypothetical protein
VVQLSVGGGLALSATLVLLSGGTQASLAQVSLSPSCSLVDPLTGLCETVTSLLPTSATPAPTTTTTTTAPLPTSTTPLPTTTTAAPVTTTLAGSTSSGTTDSGSTGTSTTSGGTGGVGGLSDLSSGGIPAFGAGGPGGLLYGAYPGSYGAGTTYFAPNGQMVSSSQIFFQSAFGNSVPPSVAAEAVTEAVRTVPVASALSSVPRRVWLAMPLVLFALFSIVYLVIEVNEGGMPSRALVAVRTPRP